MQYFYHTHIYIIDLLTWYLHTHIYNNDWYTYTHFEIHINIYLYNNNWCIYFNINSQYASYDCGVPISYNIKAINLCVDLTVNATKLHSEYATCAGTGMIIYIYISI